MTTAFNTRIFNNYLELIIKFNLGHLQQETNTIRATLSKTKPETHVASDDVLSGHQ